MTKGNLLTIIAGVATIFDVLYYIFKKGNPFISTTFWGLSTVILITIIIIIIGGLLVNLIIDHWNDPL